MPRPSKLQIVNVACHATDDFTGGDELVGQMGPLRFPIGVFDAGDSRDPGVEKLVPEGATRFLIFEKDLTGDDLLLTVDLTVDMDVPRTVRISGGDASYDIDIFVVGAAD